MFNSCQTVECDAVKTIEQKTLEFLGFTKKKSVYLFEKFSVSDSSTELLIITVLSESNKRKVFCLNSFVCFFFWGGGKALMLSLDMNRCLPTKWKQSVTAGAKAYVHPFVALL